MQSLLPTVIMKGDENMLNIKELRTAKGLTQEQLASECGVQRTTITMIELGENKPSIELAKRLGTIFDVAWSDFFEDDK